MISLKERMLKVANTHFAWNDPSHGYLPYGGYESAHDTGRWWDAVLKLEDAVGARIPDAIEAGMLENMKRMTANRYGLLLNERESDGQRVLNLHNLREGALGLTALYRFRGCAWAAERARRLADTIDRMYFQKTLAPGEIAAELGLTLTKDGMLIREPGSRADDSPTTGRALEGLLEFYALTGDAAVGAVIDKVAASNLESLFADGPTPSFIFDKNHVGHNHSYLGALRGLLRYGIDAGKGEYIRAVDDAYKNSLWTHNCTRSGFTPHDLGKLRFPDKNGDPLGEHGSLADMICLSTALGLHFRDGAYFDDAERLILARLFPSQIASEDAKQDGAWGVYAGYFGKGATPDVFSAVANALCFVYGHIADEKDGVTYVNLHLDAALPCADVSVRRTDDAEVSVTRSERSLLRIRFPGWATAADASLTADGERIALMPKDGYVSAGACGKATLRYRLPVSHTVERAPISALPYRIAWKGGEITAIDDGE